MDFRFNATTNTAEMLTETAKQIESEILKQLNELISRGLLVWQQSQIQMYQDMGFDSSIKIGYCGKLVLKDQEYIEKIEKENKQLKETLATLLTVKKE